MQAEQMRRRTDRPGVPMEREPRRVPEAHWTEPERQPEPDFPVFKRVGLERLTPVFGTSVPPRGLSGLMRRFAYGIPEHRPSHWMVLLAADRVDVLEARALERKWVLLAGLSVLGLGLLAVNARAVGRKSTGS